MTLQYATAESQAWCEAGYAVGWDQFVLAESPRTTSRAGSRPVDVDANGLLVHPLLAAPPRLAVWRAPTDNDRIGGIAARWDAWGLTHLERRLLEVVREDDCTRVRAQYSTATGLHILHEQRLRAFADGAIRIEELAEIPPEIEDLPRVGSVFELQPGPEDVEYYGLGPHETYPDRKRSGLLARWRSTVSDQYVPYIRPQENGGHADVRWFTIGGLRVDLHRPSQVSLLHFRATDLASAAHDVELTPCAETVVHVDAAHRGLGTASCGPDTLPRYLVGPGRFQWAWTISSTSAG